MAWSHGTYSGYNNHGCRCDQCREAHRDYRRILSHNTGKHQPWHIYTAEKHAKAQARPHGSESKYKQGCRCTTCRAASATARRNRRNKKRSLRLGGC